MTDSYIRAVAQAFHDGVANQDAAALAVIYHEDGKALPPNMEACEGRAAIQAGMQQLLDMGARSLDFDPLVVHRSGDLIVEYGSYTLVVEPEGAGPITDIGKYLAVHETRDGATKLLWDCYNSNAPLGAQP